MHCIPADDDKDRTHVLGIGTRNDEYEDVTDTDDDGGNQPLVKRQRTHKTAGMELAGFACFLLTDDISLEDRFENDYKLAGYNGPIRDIIVGEQRELKIVIAANDAFPDPGDFEQTIREKFILQARSAATEHREPILSLMTNAY